MYPKNVQIYPNAASNQDQKGPTNSVTSLWGLIHQGTQRALDKGTVSKYLTWTSETKSSSWVRVTLYKSPYSPGDCQDWGLGGTFHRNVQ